MKRIEFGFLLAAVTALALVGAAPLVVSSANDGTAAATDIDYDQPTPDVPETAGTATVDGESFDSIASALEAADPGDRITLQGVFEEHVTVDTDGVTLTSEAGAAIDGGGEGTVLTVTGENVTVENVWIRESGYAAGDEDAGVFVDGHGTTLDELYLSAVTYGVWIDGVDDVTVTDSYIEGRQEVQPPIERGNGIHLWETDNATIEETTITTVRDGIYYSWAEGVYAANNTFADSRYGVHYMYSNDNRLEGNRAVDNDVGYALMVSDSLEIVDNEAIRNDGTSGHGILIKDIEDSEIRGNVLVENKNGLYVYNSFGNDLEANLLIGNEVGIQSTAGSERQRVVGNTFVDNDRPAVTTTQSLQEWNGTERGNYWSSARPVDATGDGISDTRYRPTGTVEHIVQEHPEAQAFAESPAFDAVRLAESSFPVIQSPGIVDRKPLTEPVQDPDPYLDEIADRDT